MKLQEIFDQLSSGEFSQLSIGQAPAGVLDDSNYGKVIGHINLGLTTLYTRFNLKEGRSVLTLDPTNENYTVMAADLLKIERVLTDDGLDMGLNTASDPYSCFTPSMNMVRVPREVLARGPDLPDWLKTDHLTVVYRANHPKLSLQLGSILFPERKDVELPYTHLLPLLYFVASRVHAPVGMTNEGNTSAMYYGKYEAACQELEAKGLQVDNGDQNTRLCRGGWA